MDNAIIIQNARDMMAARQYTVDEVGGDFIKAYKQSTQRKVYLYIVHGKLNKKMLQVYYEIHQLYGVNHIILVHDNITPAVRNISKLYDLRIELYSFKIFMLNITQHELQPLSFEKVTIDKVDKYPTMRRNDPIAKYYDFKDGDVIKIVRKDGSIYFRVVR